MNFSEFQQTVREILAVELPAGNLVRNQARAMAADIRIGRTAFLDRMGIGSELEYKTQCLKDNRIMFHAHNGMALEYARRLKEEMAGRGVDIPVVLGGILNQKVESQSLPVDVTGDLKELGFNPCPKLGGNFRRLLENSI